MRKKASPVMNFAMASSTSLQQRGTQMHGRQKSTDAQWLTSCMDCALFSKLRLYPLTFFL